ncbi:flavin reductase family protein [Actinomadura sp. NEAU-AAG7]|uniref:flavin reductase family protein n=1 Tax=Actinomadura sp. NEAU-AAG7 TaxID=2839640 RepID=UPI001BE47666|nr:flavin reductase family protein [Actinomadura sp. NEAU-AAG7]MBT2213809.1 flavin reductase family protein [Actinomadura sp. NEAU-AAG7]
MGHGAGASASTLAGDAAARPSDREPPGVDGTRFRSVLGRFATGVVAITAVEDGTDRPAGLAANSFTSVSLDPPLVAFCVAHTSTTWPRLRGAARLCVNILSEPQLEVCERLALRGGDKFAGIDWRRTPNGGPLIEGALAWIECSVEQEHVAGDHVIVVARVHDLDHHHDADPLLFYKGTYGTFT